VEWAEPEVEPADDHLPHIRKKAFNKKYLNTKTTKTTTKANRKNIKNS
jgi:hypothetical protein